MRALKLLVPALALAIPVVGATLAGATHTNYVNNADFSQGTSYWTDYDWQKTDLSVTAAGALSVKAKQPNDVFSYASVAQCLLIPGDQFTYQLTGEVLIPAGQGKAGYANVTVQSYTSPDCALSQPNFAGEQTFYIAGVTHTASFQFTPVSGATALRLKVGVGTNQLQPGEDPLAVLEAQFDNISIVTVEDDQAPGGPVDPPADPPADPTPADPTPDPGNPPSDPADPPQDPGDPPAEPEKPVVPDVPKPWTVPAVPQGPFDVVIPGPLGGTPDPGTPSKPSADEPATGPQTGQPGSDVTPTATPTAIPATTPTEPPTHAAVADTTPLPPSAGAGLASPGSHGTLFPLAGTLLALSGAAWGWTFRHGRRQR